LISIWMLISISIFPFPFTFIFASKFTPKTRFKETQILTALQSYWLDLPFHKHRFSFHHRPQCTCRSLTRRLIVRIFTQIFTFLRNFSSWVLVLSHALLEPRFPLIRDFPLPYWIPDFR
jgi:hypothetical protein